MSGAYRSLLRNSQTASIDGAASVIVSEGNLCNSMIKGHHSPACNRGHSALGQYTVNVNRKGEPRRLVEFVISCQVKASPYALMKAIKFRRYNLSPCPKPSLTVCPEGRKRRSDSELGRPRAMTLDLQT